MEINPIWIAPFVLLLGAIAVMPFTAPHWWEQNYRWTALGLGLVTASYYVIGRGEPLRVVETLHEYSSFIALIGALFVVSGGIHITVRGRSTPLENVALLAVGGIVANVLGTTGASMLLIRPFLRNNRRRVSAYHVVFFIFIVSNIGGALTPIGDPPLFLGYLRGIPFFWITQRALLPWVLSLVALLAIFAIIDTINYRRIGAERRSDIEADQDQTHISGWHNILFLAVVIGSVFIENPMFLREGLMILAAVASYATTKRAVYSANRFSFYPIVEVGFLFLGIFLTMLPALDWLAANAAALGIDSPSGYYWVTGGLSAVLDNAPTYLNFLSAALGSAGLNVGSRSDVLSFIATERGALEVIAISIAAVFFGAMTYIGNGPNFMVKAIAESTGVKMPSFFGYIVRFSIPILLPILIIVWVIFFA